MIARAALWLAMASAFTLTMIGVSRRQGRLLSNLQFDDITYMDDALGRLQQLQSRGLGALLHDWQQHPPHSPVLTLVAMGTFAALGPRDVAPYYACTITVYLAMLLTDSLTRGLYFWQKLACQIFLLSMRWTSMAATVFRPDFLASIFLAAGICWILSARSSLSFRRVTFAGAAFGLAAATKPPVFVAVFAAMGATLMCAIGLSRRRQSWQDHASLHSSRCRTWRLKLACLAASVVIALPTFIID